MGKACSGHGSEGKCIEGLVGGPEGKPLQRPRHRWDSNTKIVTEIEWEGVEWIHLVQWRALVNMVTNLWAP
jgi:Rieske Fe-S protein